MSQSESGVGRINKSGTYRKDQGSRGFFFAQIYQSDGALLIPNDIRDIIRCNLHEIHLASYHSLIDTGFGYSEVVFL